MGKLRLQEFDKLPSKSGTLALVCGFVQLVDKRR